MVRLAPVQGEYTNRKGLPGEFPGTISWEEHLQAYKDYKKRYPGSAKLQSAERLAERGGFSYGELIDHLKRDPLTWKQN